MRRKRRKFTWFPGNIIPVPNREEGSYQLNGQAGSVSVDGTAQAIQIHPLVASDFIHEGFTPTEVEPLVNVVGQEYFVERIVGKFAAHTKFNPQDNILYDVGAYVSMGIFVARATEDAVGGAAPIGTATNESALANYSPLDQANIREPWMFRRTWVLGAKNPGVTGPVGAEGYGWGQYPTTTAGYGSLGDGPHVDVKSVRRIRQDERLWCVVVVERLPLGFEVVEAQEVEVHYMFDYRVLAQLRRARNKSNF